MTHIRSQCRYLFGNYIHRQTGYCACAIHIKVSIVGTPFRTGCTNPFGNPHKQFFGSLSPQALHQIMSYLIHIHKRNLQLFSHPTRRIQILSMCIYQNISFLCHRIFRHIFAHIILCHSMFVMTKATPDNGIKQYRDTSLFSCFLHKATQIIIKSRSGLCMTRRIRLFIIMSELDKNIIPRFYFIKHDSPPPLVNETFGTAAVHGMIVHVHLFTEKASEHMSPATLPVSSVQRLIGHRGITNHKNSHCPVGSKCRKDKQGNKRHP